MHEVGMIDGSRRWLARRVARLRPAVRGTVTDLPVAPAVTPSVTPRRVLGFAGPVIGQNLLETLLGIVDTLLVAGLGAAAIAGVGSSLQIMFFLLAALAALSVGSSILIAQAVGARDLPHAGRLARQSLLWSALLGVPLALAGVAFAAPIIGIFGLEPAVARIGVSYLRVTMGTAVVLVAGIIAAGVLRGVGDSRTPMIITAIANLLNVGLTYGLIYGTWGLPALGAVGSAWGTFLARAVALLLLLRVLWQGRFGVAIAGRHGWWPDWTVARRVLDLGIPAAIEQVLLSTAFLVLTILVARLGTSTLAALRISMTALSFSFLPGIGFSIAATALVGQAIGARRPEDAAVVARVATLWAVLWMGAVGALLFVCATPVMRLFSDVPEVIERGAASLRVVAVMQPAWAVGMVQAGALRGTGDTRFPLVIGTLGIWSAVLLGWLAVTVLGGGLPLLWGGFLVTAPVSAYVTWRRVRQRLHHLALADGAA